MSCKFCYSLRALWLIALFITALCPKGRTIVSLEGVAGSGSSQQHYAQKGVNWIHWRGCPGEGGLGVSNMNGKKANISLSLIE